VRLPNISIQDHKQFVAYGSQSGANVTAALAELVASLNVPVFAHSTVNLGGIFALYFLKGTICAVRGSESGDENMMGTKLA